MTELAGTLTALHERGIVMRDVTPRNIVLGEERTVLIDFGLTAYDGFHLPGGTPGFAPARQLRDDSPLPEDDCYALGMVLAYAATGMLPLTGVTVPGPARARMLQTVTALYGEGPSDFVHLLGALLSDEPGTVREALAAPAARAWFGQEGAAHAAPLLGGGAVRVEPTELARQVLDSVLTGVGTQLLPAPGTSISAVDAGVHTGSSGNGLELLHHSGQKGVPELLTRLASHAVAAAHRVDLAPGLLAGSTGIQAFLAALRNEGHDAPELPEPRELSDTAGAGHTDDARHAEDTGTRDGPGGAAGTVDAPHTPAGPGPGPDSGDDILSGAAGIGLGHLFLSDLTQGPARTARLDLAREHTEQLLSRDGRACR